MELFKIFGTIEVQDKPAIYSLDKVEDKAKELDKKVDTLGGQIKKAFSTKSIQNFGKGLQNVGGKITAVGKKFAPVSAAAGAAVTGLVGLGVKAGQTADDLNTLSKVTGLTTNTIQKMKYAADIVDVSFETIQGSMAKLTKNMGAAKNGSAAMQDAFKKLNVEYQVGNGNLKDSEAVFYDMIDALGKVESQAERDAIAMELFGRSAQELNPLILGGADALRQMGEEAEKRGLIMTQEELDAANAMNDELDKMKADTGQTLMRLGVEISRALLPVLQKGAEMLNNFLDWIRSLDEGTLKTIMTILSFVAVLTPIILVVGKVVSAIGMMISFFTTLIPMIQGAGVAMTVLTGPVGLVVAAVAAVIAIGVALYKNWDVVVDKAKQFGGFIGDIFKKIGETLMAPFRAASDFIKKQIDKIKGFFSGFKIQFPKIKLPHFKLKGSFSLAPPSVPKLGIEWRAKGGFMPRATVFGQSGNMLQGGGEAGGEGIVPLEGKHMYPLVDAMAARLNNQSGGSITNVFNVQATIREDADINKLAKEMDKLQTQTNRARGRVYA